MLELKNISMKVDESKEILANLNLTIGQGKFVVITGPNGGGKSTLAKIISGIEKVTAGQILFHGIDITNKSITDRARLGISFAFQQPVRFKGITVRDLLMLASENQYTEQKLHASLRDVGLCPKDYLDREVNSSLSGGEIKRIEIAMVIARNSELTIFDEPEAGIDLWSFQNLIQVFKKLRQESNGSVIIISHQERILDIADEIVVLSEGKIAAQGAKDTILPNLLRDSKDCKFLSSRKKAIR